MAPDSEAALAEVAEAANAVGQFDRAEEAATRALGLNPRSIDLLLARSASYSGRKQWEKAEEDCRAALHIQPLYPMARLALAVCLHARGDPAAGKKEAETAIALSMEPHRKSAFRDWYSKQTR